MAGRKTGRDCTIQKISAIRYVCFDNDFLFCYRILSLVMSLVARRLGGKVSTALERLEVWLGRGWGGRTLSLVMRLGEDIDLVVGESAVTMSCVLALDWLALMVSLTVKRQASCWGTSNSSRLSVLSPAEQAQAGGRDRWWAGHPCSCTLVVMKCILFEK